jgi:hypothetical protein
MHLELTMTEEYYMGERTSTLPVVTTPIDSRHPGGRDPGIDHPDELHPQVREAFDMAGVIERDHLPVRAANVDDNGVAHFLRITPDPSEPDYCGGCEKEWPCEGRVPLQVVELPQQ